MTAVDVAPHRSTKVLAWFALINGALTLVTPVAQAALFGRSVPAFAAGLAFVLGVAGVAAGWAGLRGRAWGFWLLFLTFLVQAVDYASADVSFSLVGPLSLKFALLWNSPPSKIGFNILAIVVCVLAVRAVDQLGAPPRSEANVAAGGS